MMRNSLTYENETKSSPLPTDSPGIAEMVKLFKETTTNVSKTTTEGGDSEKPAEGGASK